jgi:hypothetical protein
MDIVSEVGKVVGLETEDLVSMHVSIMKTMLEPLSWLKLFLCSLHHEANTMLSRRFGLEKKFKSMGSN